MNQKSITEYPNIWKLFKRFHSGVKIIYVTPLIEEAGKNNPYIFNLYKVPSNENWAKLQPLTSYQFLKPFLNRFFKNEKSIWHQHWYQFSNFPTFIRTNFRLMATWLYVKGGGVVLWTIHNQEPHTRKYLRANRFYSKCLSKLVTGFHVHSKYAAEVVSHEYNIDLDRIFKVPHPVYDVQFFSSFESKRALRRYGVAHDERPIFLVFGMMARYKGIVELVAMMNSLSPQLFQFILAGSIRTSEKDYGLQLKNLISNPSILFLDKHIPEEDVPYFFGATDYVLFNYQKILTTGALQLARDYKKKIFLPNLPGLCDIHDPTLQKFDSLDDLRIKIESILKPLGE